eukprot:scaffold2017_cov387-Prasinococcus_capsulatus_cf.AAC.6
MWRERPGCRATAAGGRAIEGVRAPTWGIPLLRTARGRRRACTAGDGVGAGGVVVRERESESDRGRRARPPPARHGAVTTGGWKKKMEGGAGRRVAVAVAVAVAVVAGRRARCSYRPLLARPAFGAPARVHPPPHAHSPSSSRTGALRGLPRPRPRPPR